LLRAALPEKSVGNALTEYPSKKKREEKTSGKGVRFKKKPARIREVCWKGVGGGTGRGENRGPSRNCCPCEEPEGHSMP